MYRVENDLIGNVNVPVNAYYGVQTQNLIANLSVKENSLQQYPEVIRALAYLKWAAAVSNAQLELLEERKKNAIVQACVEIIEGKFNREFPVDMVKNEAMNAVNTNINEVIANRALEIMGYEKGQYQYCSPLEDVNLSQDIESLYPIAVKLTILNSNKKLIQHLQVLTFSAIRKARELQKAEALRSGQKIEEYAFRLDEKVQELTQKAKILYPINTETIDEKAPFGYALLFIENLKKITHYDFLSSDEVAHKVSDTERQVLYAKSLKNVAIELSSMINDLNVFSLGEWGIAPEIDLPSVSTEVSSILEEENSTVSALIDQVVLKVIGNDLTLSFASKASVLQCATMQPVMLFATIESMRLLLNGMDALRVNCIDGISINAHFQPISIAEKVLQ